MTKNSVDPGPDRSATPIASRALPPQRDPTSCGLYEPGHLIHYKHQGDAVRSPSRNVREALLDETALTLLLQDGSELHWRHHDPERLRRIIQLLRGRAVAYPSFHALRVGPYWFNCATEKQDWQDCRAFVDPRRQP